MSENVLTREQAIWLLKKMREIRQFSERIISIYPTDVMVTPVHLCIGQEAVPVGICANLNKTDYIFISHRTQGPALAKGMDIKSLMAELYGRKTGCSGGYGGSMHLVDPAIGILGSSAIVGGGIALGVGAGLACKLKKEDRISVSYFGDGATDSGVFWESLNFAALKEIPVLFVCENNFLSNVMPKSEHMYVEIPDVTEKFMPTWSTDGTDVIAVFSAAKEAAEYVRNNRKPAFIECKTKRWMKHQGVEKDDLPYNPVIEELDCPIRKHETMLLEKKWITQQEIKKIVNEIESMIDQAIEYAIQSERPSESELITEV